MDITLHKSLDDALIEPLVDMDQTEISYDDDDESVACTCTIQIGSEEEEDEDEATVTCRDTTILLLLFPLLLMAQFGLIFSNPMLDSSLGVSWSTVNYVIVLFAITSWLYRHTLADLKVSNLLLLVMPEIFLNVVLGLVLWGNAAMGFTGLLSCLFVFGLFVTLSSLRILICSAVYGEADEEPLVDEETNAGRYIAVTY